MRTNGFEEINTVECLRRIHEFRYQHRSKIYFTVDQHQEDLIEKTTLKREAVDDGEEAIENKKLKNDSQTRKKRQTRETDSMLTAIGPLAMPGHTGYLTFAYLKQE